MKTTITLTKTDVTSIISTGNVLHSELAEDFISLVRRETGIELVACYFDSDQRLIFEQQKRKLFGRKKTPQYEFINFSHLTVYAKKIADADILQLAEKLEELFCSLLEKEHIEISYERSLTLQELEYYGFQNKPTSEWDEALIIQPTSEPKTVFTATIEDFESLAMWHILSNSCNAVSKNATLSYYNARVFCGFDEDTGKACHYICTYGKAEQKEVLCRVQNGSLVDELYKTVKKRDRCNVLTRDGYAPNVVLWGELSNERRFDLLRN